MFKKVVSFMLGLLMCFPVMACKEKIEAGTLEINFTIAGYGEDYITELLDAFTKSTGINVAYTTDDNATNSAIGRITSVKKNTTDIFFTMHPCFSLIDANKNKSGYDNLFMDLSDLYEMEVPGKNGKKLKEVVRQDLYETNITYNIDGTAGTTYIVPWTASVEGFVANKKVLANYGIMSLPRTTDEFEEVLDLIKSGKTADGEIVAPANRSSGLTCANNSAYWTFIWSAWWAQYEGLEGIDKYFAARPDGATEPYIPDWQALESDGKLNAIEETSRFIYKGNGYMEANCANRDHLTSQVDFLDGKAAFIPSGAWLETESANDFYKEGKDVSFVFMKVPVTSKLCDKYDISEEELRNAIDYADGLTTTSPSYEGKSTSEAEEITAEIVKARGVVSSILTSQNKAVVSAYTTEKDEAYKFLLWYASDEAQAILVKYGIMSAFGYKEVPESSTEFLKSMFDVLNRDNTQLLTPGTRYPMAYKAGLDFTAHTTITSANKGFENLLYNGTKTPQAIYDKELDYFKAKWSQMLVNAGYGKTN